MGSGPRVFIAGAHTYLGSRVAAVCQERDCDVVVLAHENQETYALRAIGVEVVTGSTLEPEGWKNVLKRCDWAMNLNRHTDFGAAQGAARGAREGAAADLGTRTLDAINVEGAINFLDTCIAMDVPKVLTLSSVLAIGDHRGELADESFEHRRQFRSYYEKTLYDAFFQTKVRLSEGARIACVLPGPILGPRSESPFAGIVEAFVQERLPWGVVGPSQFTFTYIDDVVRGIFQIMDRRAPVGLYIFANEPITWEGFFEKLEAVSGVSPAKGWLKEGKFERKAKSAAAKSERRRKAAPVARELLPYMVDAQYRFSSEKARQKIGWDFSTMEIWLAEMIEEIRTAEEGPATQAAIETFSRSSLPAGY